MLKCSAILGDFFMKSEGVTLENKRTHRIKEKGESEVEGKILGLFDDDSYREERKLQRISSIADVVSTNFKTNLIVTFCNIFIQLILKLHSTFLNLYLCYQLLITL